MKDSWDFIFFSFLIYYLVSAPYSLGTEEDVNIVHNSLVHNQVPGFLSGTVSVFIFPVFRLFGIKAGVFFARFLLLLLFFVSSYSLRKSVIKEFGDETGVSFYLITALQPRIGINSSRFLFDNYSFITGTVCMVFYLNKKKTFF